MTPEIIKARLLCKQITNYYVSLMRLVETHDEDTDEYEELIGKIKRAVLLEKKAYSEVDITSINNFFETHDKETNDVSDCRLIKRLEERLSFLTEGIKTSDGKLFDSIFDYKMTLDAFKLIRKRIVSIKDENEEDEIYKKIVLYHHISKYTHFVVNSYAEDIALDYNFNIDEMPAMTFEEIDEMFNVDTIEMTAPGLGIAIFNNLDRLYEINTNDAPLNTYLALTALSQIEVSLNCLNKEELTHIYETYQIIYGESKKEQMTAAKKLIRNKLD